MFETISVSTTSTSKYEYHVGIGLLEKVRDFIASNFGTQKLLIVIDRNVHQHHVSRVHEVFEPTFGKILTYVVPPGERSKGLEQFSSILDYVLKEGLERKTPLLAIGGGVVGDLSGFVAASALRGIPLIHVPTSLLAMVDSSIGGKTGINHFTGKNLIGAFYQPKAVFADIDFLETLPSGEWVNGLSEIIKYGMIEAPELLDELRRLTKPYGFAAPGDWVNVIRKSAQIKVDIVERDVLEAGIRAFLNFGHTYGHVIERIGEYSKYSHGEAVFAGMYGALSASNQLGHSIDRIQLDDFKRLYSINLEGIQDVNELIGWMYKDKKVSDEVVRLVLLEKPGKPFVYKVEEERILKESWKFLLNEFQ